MDFRCLRPKKITPKKSIAAEEELSRLEISLKAEGCREALIVWEGVLIDGHNRYEICSKNDIPFEISERFFESRDDAQVMDHR